jgi:hypothetical protein
MFDQATKTQHSDLILSAIDEAYTPKSVYDPKTGTYRHEAKWSDITKMPVSLPDNISIQAYAKVRSNPVEVIDNTTVSSVYKGHEREHVTRMLLAGGEVFEQKPDLTLFWDKGQHAIMTESGEGRTIFGKDRVKANVLMRARYDGCIDILGFLGRLICRNGMRMSVKDVHMKFKHTQMLEYRVEQFAARMHRMKAAIEKSIEQAKHLQETEIRIDDLLNAVYPRKENATEQIMENEENRVLKILRRLEQESLKLGVPVATESRPVTTAWLGHNAIQGYVQHDMTRHGATRLDRMVKALDDKDNVIKRSLDYVLAI